MVKMEYIESMELVDSGDYIPKAKNLISRFNKIAANMTNNDELERKEKELKSQLEVADNIEERKRLRLELKEVRQKLFSSNRISKETSRIVTKDVNNNIIPADIKPKQPDVSQVSKPTTSLTTHDRNNNQSINAIAINLSNKAKTESTPTFSGSTFKVSLKDTKEDKNKEDKKSVVNDNTSNNIINVKIDNTKEESKDTTNKLDKEPKEETKSNNMSVTIRTSSRFAKNTDTNNNEEGVNGYSPADRAVSAEERAARRAKRAERMNGRADETDVCTSSTTTSSVTNRISSMTMNDNKSDERPGSVGGIRGRTHTWSPQKSTTSSVANKFGGTGVSSNKFQFGVDYSKKTTPESSSRPLPGKISQNKYTPTMNASRPKSTAYTPTNRIGGGGSNNPGRFQGIQRDEPEAPAFGGSAQDRMAQFRAAMEKEKAQKEKEEERKKQAEQRKKDDEERRKQEAEKKKEEEAKKKEEEEKRAAEAKNEEDMPDSEKIKHQAPCKKKREKKPARRTMSISNIVLDWVQEMTKDYPVSITNFSSSWNNGLAFCALIHKFNPDEFDFDELKPENKRHNFDLAFQTGEKCKNIPILLDTEDMVRMKKPEPRSVQTYIQWIWSVYGPTSGYGPTPQEVQSATLS